MWLRKSQPPQHGSLSTGLPEARCSDSFTSEASHDGHCWQVMSGLAPSNHMAEFRMGRFHPNAGMFCLRWISTCNMMPAPQLPCKHRTCDSLAEVLPAPLNQAMAKSTNSLEWCNTARSFLAHTILHVSCAQGWRQGSSPSRARRISQLVRDRTGSMDKARMISAARFWRSDKKAKLASYLRPCTAAKSTSVSSESSRALDAPLCATDDDPEATRDFDFALSGLGV